MSGDTLVTDGLIHHFNANDPASFTAGNEFMTDLQGSAVTMNSRSGVATSLADGGLDFSLGNNRMRLSEAVTFRTISVWYQKNESVVANPLFVTDSTGGFLGFLASRAIGSGGYSGGQFFPTADVYVDGVVSDIAVGWNDLPDGELHNVVFMGQADITAIMTVMGSGTAEAYQVKSILHSVQFYDKVLSESELLQNFYAGSGASALNVVPSPINITVTITDAGATSYKLTYTPDGGSETTAVSSTTELLHTIVNLQPETNYTVSLYIDDVFEDSVSTTTLANSAANYEPTDFDDGSGGFDISSFDSTARALFSEIMNDVFTTGDDVTLSLNSGQTVSAKFVKRGESVSIENTDAVVMPFDASAGALQTVDLTLTDTSTEAVDYNESTETITINTVEYSEGDVLVLDGKKVVVSSS